MLIMVYYRFTTMGDIKFCKKTLRAYKACRKVVSFNVKHPYICEEIDRSDMFQWYFINIMFSGTVSGL